MAQSFDDAAIEYLTDPFYLSTASNQNGQILTATGTDQLSIITLLIEEIQI